MAEVPLLVQVYVRVLLGEVLSIGGFLVVLYECLVIHVSSFAGCHCNGCEDHHQFLYVSLHFFYSLSNEYIKFLLSSDCGAKVR